MGTVSGGRRRAFRSRHHSPMGKGGKLAVIFVCTALILFVFAVMLGNYLRGLAEAVIEDTTEPSTTEEEIYYANAPDEVIAMGIYFGGEFAADATETQAETAEEDTSVPEEPIRFDSISLTLREKDRESGEMLLAYSSPISLEYGIDVTGETSLEDGLAEIKSFYGEKMPICGVFEIDHLERPTQSRDIMRAYEIALICELIDAGIEEIVLVGFDYEVEEGISFISDIYEQKGRGTAIGLALPFDFFVSAEAQGKLSEITKRCGFLALDLCSLKVPALMTAESLITDRVSRTRAICREFSVRVLLGCGENPDCESQTRAAMDAGADNVMTAVGIFMPKEENITEEITAE
ncbi:MAG: hypothetical protein IKK01_10800 [Clostridia bacterium]|nr:hypothetical protein [Clostridia bacterium]